MIVEDKILEYLDGSLGESESAELLETLSVSPEKRALLEEHLRLKDLLNLGRKPFSVPIETERELARRIPILGRYNNNLVPARWAFSGVRRFIGARAIGLAMGAGAMLVLAGLGWYSMQQPTVSIRGNGTNGTNMTDMSQKASLQFSSASTNFSVPTARAASGNFRLSSGHLSHNNAILPPAGTPSIAGESADQTPEATPVTTLRESAARIPVSEFSPQTMNEIRLGPPGQLSPMTIGTSLILDESYLPTLSTGPQHTLQNLLEDVTFDYDLSPNFAIGIDIGEGTSSSIRNSPIVINPSQNYTRVFNNVAVGGQTIYDAMFAIHYTLFPESEYQLRLGADGGTAFGAGPMAEATAGISRVLAPNLLLDVTAIASRVWTNGSSPISNTESNGVVGIVGAQVSPRSMYTTAFGIRAGLRIRL